MAANMHLLRNLCPDPDTHEKAGTLLRLAQKKTAAGSGFELGSHTTGLPAICAYLASQQLQNNVVSRKGAQAASCLKASDFDKALQIVQAAIVGSRRQVGTGEIYDGLIREYELSSDRNLLMNWLSIAERTILGSESKFNSEDQNLEPRLKYTLFYWLYNVYTGKNLASQQEYAEDHKMPPRSLSKLLKEVGSCCSSLKSQIQTEIVTRQSSPHKTPVTTPRRSPKKAALRVLPSRDSPSKRKEAPDESHPDQNTSETEVMDIETPSKRRRPESPSKPATRNTSPIKPLVFPPVASSSRVALDDTSCEAAVTPKKKFVTYAGRRTTVLANVESMDVDQDRMPSSLQAADIHENDEDEDEDEDGPPVRTRFRPVFLDHKQWYSVDRLLERIRKKAEQYVVRHRGQSGPHSAQ